MNERARRRQQRRRRAAGALAVTAALLTVTACRADARDFAEQAQRFIVYDADLAALAGTGFSGATCTSPASTAPGTVFACTGDATDGTTWTFTVTIGDGGTYTVAVADLIEPT